MTLRGMALTRRGGGPSGTMIIDFVFRFDSDSISDYVNYLADLSRTTKRVFLRVRVFVV